MNRDDHKIVQIARSDRESQDLYIGAPGELTEDTSNGDLRLHDGVTPGGRVIMSRENADDRYQRRSPELDGLLDFEPQDRGVLVRRGPKDYRLRTLTGSKSIAIQFGNGYGGNPTYTLAATVETDHTFSGSITFDKKIQAKGGIAGDIVGNVVGNLKGNVEGNLEGNADGEHTGKFTGNVDTSGGTLKLGNGQITLDSLDADVGAYIDAAGCPQGSIILWHGLVSQIPAGWFLCDGANGTPDLRDRFVCGASEDADVDTTFGGLTHSHTITVNEGGEHTHEATFEGTISSAKTGITIAQTTRNVDAGGSAKNVPSAPPTITDPGHTHDLSGLTGELKLGGKHGHTASAEATNHLPPSYALAYIMKGL